jgi:bifunctional non-homologous end joining protein LigD
MARPLDDYARKRDFARTSEPPPGAASHGPAGPVFVVHRHEARNLHYDLRLERDGVLVSFAVPKGFSYASNEKRLALRTEDHPLAYEDFQGVIPKGEYGAGTMTIWDRGRYALKPLKGGADPFQAGELKLLLYGRKLRGEWHLVKTSGGPNHWLIFKSRDRYAGVRRDTALGIDLSSAPESALPAELPFQEPKGTRAPFSDPAWLFEARFDGLRALARKHGDAVTWGGARRALALPALEAELGKIRAADALLDGVLVRLDEHERPSREALDAALAAGEETGVVFYAFDLLHWEDYDLSGLALVERKQALRALLPPLARVLFMDHVLGEGEGLAQAVAAAGLAGLVAKRADAPRRAGRSADWVAIQLAPRGKGAGQPARAPAVPVTRILEARRGKAAVERRARFSNLDKVYFPAEGITKGELLAYYESVADVLVPYLSGRAVHLNRFPDGIEGKSFYQKEAKEETPAWVRTVELTSKSREEGVLRYMVCDDRDTLLHLVNLGSIDLHPWMSRVETPDEPDYAVLDLDPKEAPFANVVRIARELGRILRGIGLRPLLKTSGKTGLHVVIPLAPGHGHEHSALFCEGVARLVVRELPAIATIERAIGSRAGKVYVDFGQNRKGQTVVPPYVVRPVPGAQVSTPLAWDELEGEPQPSHFTIRNVPERLARLGDLFAPLFADRQEIAPAIARLEAYLAKRR